MPWSPGDAARHDKKAASGKKARQWAHVANSVLKRTGDEGLAVREANGVVKRSKSKSTHDHAMDLGSGHWK
jgi:hypothetical protein